MIVHEEISPTLMMGTLQSVVSDCAMSGRTPTNHCLDACLSDVWCPERLRDSHMVTQPASRSHTLGILSVVLFNRLPVSQTTEDIFMPIAQIPSPFFQ